MTKQELLTVMAKLNACQDATKWVEAAQDEDAKSIWNKCERADWMLWLAGRADLDRKVLVTTACQIARTALKFIPEGEDRPLKAIEAAEGWVEGRVTIEEVRAARAAACAADAADAADAAAYAADAAAYAADAAARATYAAAYAAADAAYAAARATYAAAYAAGAAADAARQKSLAESAEIVKKNISWGMIEEKLSKI